MIVDELVSIIRFDMPGSSKAMLGKVDGIVSSITDKVKSLGIVSAVTSGLFAAFSVNAANEAMDLAKLSHSTGIATDEIEAMGAVYRSVGGDAKNFWADAEAMKRSTGRSLNIESMIKHAEVFAGMSKDVAYQMGRAQGFSDDMIRVLMMGPDQLRSMATEAVKYNSTSKDSLDNLTALHKAWAGFRDIMTPVANEVQAAFAPLLGDGLKAFGDLLKENKESIKETMTAISGYIRSAFSGMFDFFKSSNISEVFVSIKSSLSSFYTEIEKVVNSGTIQSIVSSMREIANSPLITGTVAAAFTALTAAIKPAFDILNGLFEVLSGIVNIDFNKIKFGFAEIGHAIGNIFLDILPKLGEMLIDIISRAINKAMVATGIMGSDSIDEKGNIKGNKQSQVDLISGFWGGVYNDWFGSTPVIEKRSINDSGNIIPSSGNLSNENISNTSNSTNNTTTNNIYVYPNGNDSSMDSLSRVTGLRN